MPTKNRYHVPLIANLELQCSKRNYPFPAAEHRGMSLCSVIDARRALNSSTLSLCVFSTILRIVLPCADEARPPLRESWEWIASLNKSSWMTKKTMYNKQLQIVCCIKTGLEKYIAFATTGSPYRKTLYCSRKRTLDLKVILTSRFNCFCRNFLWAGVNMSSTSSPAWRSTSDPSFSPFPSNPDPSASFNPDLESKFSSETPSCADVEVALSSLFRFPFFLQYGKTTAYREGQWGVWFVARESIRTSTHKISGWFRIRLVREDLVLITWAVVCASL